MIAEAPISAIAVPAQASPGATVTTPPRPPGSFAAQARLAAELAQERHTALELQRAILPLHDEPFDLAGLRVAARYLPASRASRVGGDWYITAEMPDSTVLVAIGDVGGHGLAAAAGMARLRGALAGLAFTGEPPDRLIGWLNDLVWHVAAEHTATAVVGFFDPASRVLTWAQAGHPPPILTRDGWAATLDPPRGIVLGAGKERYELAVQPLVPGDVLMLYTDGLIERRGSCVDDGVACLVSAVRGSREPERAIRAALSARETADTDDDACVVALAVQ